MTSRTEEDFELELRALPGVVSVGLTYRDNGDVDAVALVVSGEDAAATHSVARQIASLYFPDARVSVEGTMVPPSSDDGSRVALVRANLRDEDGSCEVELRHGERVGVGSASSGPLIGGAEATLAALRQLGYEIPFSLMAVNSVATLKQWPVLVTLRSLVGEGDRFGVASAEEETAAAAKATLDALNRYLATH